MPRCCPHFEEYPHDEIIVDDDLEPSNAVLAGYNRADNLHKHKRIRSVAKRYGHTVQLGSHFSLQVS